ncbi:hypothetical protein LCGC14_1337520 [marine sediment metagenome]|uniref:Uncharacterized protein n=1 Tax=marine sediment metagenome TaxID=412755 RepID=A0A0F9KFE3_9ZZZZ
MKFAPAPSGNCACPSVIARPMRVVLILICTFATTPPLTAHAGGPVQVVPLAKDAPASFTGLLVPGKRFTELLRAELQVQELKGQLSIQEKTAQALEAMYLGKLKQATTPVPWYKTPSFNRWFGFGLGMVCTGLAIWGTIEFYRAVK